MKRNIVVSKRIHSFDPKLAAALLERAWERFHEDGFPNPLTSCYANKTIIVVSATNTQFILFADEIETVFRKFGGEFIAEVKKQVKKADGDTLLLIAE